jgi:hopanoid biosynthesis associated protein HpnK
MRGLPMQTGPCLPYCATGSRAWQTCVDHSYLTVPPKPTVRLIVNADDFGRTPEVNAAVARAHDTGIVTSASLMVAAPAAAEAVALARERPGLAVGLHVVVLGGQAVLPSAAIPHLVNAEGRFPRAAFATGVRYFFSSAARRELAREMRAQFEAFGETGLLLSHVDGHHHMHLHPTVFALLLPLAREYGARGIRVSVADELLFSLRGDATHFWLKLGWKIAFFFLAVNARRLLRQSPVPAADRVYGLMQTGHVTKEYLARLLERLAGVPGGMPPEGPARAPRGRCPGRSPGCGLPVVELFCHPSLRRESLNLGPNPGDLEAVTSPDVMDRLRKLRIELTTYPAAFPAAPGGAPGVASGPGGSGPVATVADAVPAAPAGPHKSGTVQGPPAG